MAKRSKFSKKSKLGKSNSSKHKSANRSASSRSRNKSKSVSKKKFGHRKLKSKHAHSAPKKSLKKMRFKHHVPKAKVRHHPKPKLGLKKLAGKAKLAKKSKTYKTQSTTFSNPPAIPSLPKTPLIEPPTNPPLLALPPKVAATPSSVSFQELTPSFSSTQGRPPYVASAGISARIDLLPSWTDREKLNRFIQELGLVFSTLSRGSPDYREAVKLLSTSRTVDPSNPNYFIVCAKDSSGKLIGVTDGYLVRQLRLIVIVRSVVSIAIGRAEAHLVLHAAALSQLNPTLVVCYGERPALSQPASASDAAGRLICLGRGFGMAIVPLQHPSKLVFLRRVGREYDPLSFGSELAVVLSALKSVGLDPSFDLPVAELTKKGAVALIMLPISPDRREHIHELEDAAIGLGFTKAQLANSFDQLLSSYVTNRADLTPNRI